MRRLGQSGLYVSELCLGTMTFGEADGIWSQLGRVEQATANDLLRAAFDAGINFVDTANTYAGGESERILGQAMRDLGIARDDIVVATKVFGPMGDGPNGRGASRRHIISQCHASLARLQLEHIDLYQIHGFDAATPIVETLDALNSLVQQGLVRYVGLSNWAAWQVVKATGLAEARHFSPVLSLQAYYSLVGRDIEREIGPMLVDQGIGLMVWSPLAAGYLSGKYRQDGKASDGRRAILDFPPVDVVRGAAALSTLEQVSNAKGCSMAQVAIAWLLHQGIVTSVIVGAKRIEQLMDNVAATTIALDVDELALLEEASRPQPEYPTWMFDRQGSYRR